jgi:acyl carrier protein
MTSTVTHTQSTSLLRLKAAFIAALELDADAEHTILAYRETPTWDSLAHMQLVIAIESAFDVMLETSDVLALSSFTEACTILRRHGVTL